MRIDNDGLRICPGENKKIGIFNGIDIFECHPCQEEMKMTAKNFDIMAGIIDGFLKMGRGLLPNLSSEVNEILKSKETEVKYSGVTVLGFYCYKIKHGNREIEFAIEPNLLPIYNYCVNDMMRRHRETPLQSYVSTEAELMYSPLTKIDDAIKKISELMEQKKTAIENDMIEKEDHIERAED